MGKQKRDKRIIRLARKISNLENEIRLGKNVKENEAEIQRITSSLSLQDMLEIDEYITIKHYCV